VTYKTAKIYFIAWKAVDTQFLLYPRNIKQVKIYTNFKIWRTKGAWSRSRESWATFVFRDPLYISGMGTVRDFKFGLQIDRQAYK